MLALHVTEADTPESLRRRNYIKFTGGRSFVVGLRELSVALRENIDWIREHTRLGELAARWRQRDRQDDLLLRGAELESALAWLSQWNSPAPEPTAAQREFIGASEVAEIERSSAERQRLATVALAQADRAQALSRARRSQPRAPTFGCLAISHWPISPSRKPLVAVAWRTRIRHRSSGCVKPLCCWTESRTCSAVAPSRSFPATAVNRSTGRCAVPLFSALHRLCGGHHLQRGRQSI